MLDRRFGLGAGVEPSRLLETIDVEQEPLPSRRSEGRGSISLRIGIEQPPRPLTIDRRQRGAPDQAGSTVLLQPIERSDQLVQAADLQLLDAEPHAGREADDLELPLIPPSDRLCQNAMAAAENGGPVALHAPTSPSQTVAAGLKGNAAELGGQRFRDYAVRLDNGPPRILHDQKLRRSDQDWSCRNITQAEMRIVNVVFEYYFLGGRPCARLRQGAILYLRSSACPSRNKRFNVAMPTPSSIRWEVRSFGRARWIASGAGSSSCRSWSTIQAMDIAGSTLDSRRPAGRKLSG